MSRREIRTFTIYFDTNGHKVVGSFTVDIANKKDSNEKDKPIGLSNVKPVGPESAYLYRVYRDKADGRVEDIEVLR